MTVLLFVAFVAAAVWLAGTGPPRRVAALTPVVPVVPARLPWRARLAGSVRGRAHGGGEPTPDTVAVLADRLGALLRSGLGEDQAWRALAEREDAVAALARTVVGTRSLGGDTAEGLRRVHGQQHRPEHGPEHGPEHMPERGRRRRRRRAGESSPELAWLALAWEVSQVCGAPLTGVLDGIAATIRAEAEADRARRTALAGPRATATVLTWLPLGGLGLGLLIGADVIEVLLTTGPGRGCLALGAGLWWAGRAWTGRLLHRAATDRA